MTSPSSLTTQLVTLLATHSLRRGTFVLTSGQASSYYIDARLTTMRADGLTIIGQLALRRFQTVDWHPTAVGGLTLGADPIAFSIALQSVTLLHPINAFTVRKEPKSHATRQQIEGPVTSSDRVVIVEDVLTTGGSALRAAAAIQTLGATIHGVLAVVDRQEGGSEALITAGFEVQSLTTITEILAIR